MSGVSAFCQVDSARMDKLNAMLDSYLLAIEPESVPVKARECDMLISSCTDSILRQEVALKLYDHYYRSPLMGDETIAVYLYDRWFGPGEIKMESEGELSAAGMFADFNRPTLLGQSAPVLDMFSPDWEIVKMPSAGRPSVLYFYDTSCSKCRIMSVMIPYVMEDADFKINLFAIYCGSQEEEWAEYRTAFEVKNPNVNLVHVWDPDSETDFIRQYGVLATPKLYLLDSKGTVVGRRLEIETLKQLLPIVKPVDECACHGQCCCN